MLAKFFFETFLGKAVAAGIGLVALVGAFAWDQRSRGAANAITSVNDKAEVVAEKARAARSRVPDGGNADWLRKHSCRDC